MQVSPTAPPRPVRAAMLLVFACTFAPLVAGCARPTLRNVTDGLAAQGYAIWFPAETGVEPGQIWLYDGTLRSKFADRPVALPLNQHGGPAIDVLERRADATGVLSSEFTSAVLSEASPFGAELVAGTARRGTVTFEGPVDATSVDFGQALSGNDQARFGTGYAKALELVREDTPGLVLVLSTLRVSRMELTLYCDDPFKVVERLPRVRTFVDAHVDATVLDRNYVRVTLTPTLGQRLTLGITPVRGFRAEQPTSQAQAAVARDLLVAKRQQYALRLPVPDVKAVTVPTVIGRDDPPEEVLAKYQRAIGEVQASPTQASATSQPTGGRVIVPPPGGTSRFELPPELVTPPRPQTRPAGATTMQ